MSWSWVSDVIVLLASIDRLTRANLLLTVKTNEESGGGLLVRLRSGDILITGSDEFNHVTDGPVHVALTLSPAFGAERHVARPSDAAGLVAAVEQVPGARRRPRPPVGPAFGCGCGGGVPGGGEVDDGDVETLAGLGVDDPRLAGRSTRRARRTARHVGRTAAAAHRHSTAALAVRHCNSVMATASLVTSQHHPQTGDK